MKNKVLKFTFTISFLLYWFAGMTYSTGIRTWAIVTNIVTGIFIWIFTSVNRGKWIFSYQKGKVAL